MHSVSAKIHCHNCENDFYVYWVGLTHDQLKGCPHCGSRIDETMRNSIVGAIGAVYDTNYHFKKYHEEGDEDLFSIDVLTTIIPDEKFKA